MVPGSGPRWYARSVSPLSPPSAAPVWTRTARPRIGSGGRAVLE